MKVLYLDESGDHNLKKIDPRYPLFVLGGVIVDRTFARTVMRSQIRQMKLDYFGDPNIVFHTADIMRARNGFEALKNDTYRGAFFAALNALMRELDYQVVACVIDKPELIEQYGGNSADPYHYAMEVLVERFCKELGDCTDGGIVYAEMRGAPLDLILGKAWEELRTGTFGTGYIDGPIIDERICELVLKEKRLNIDGLQLADLVVAPIARKAMRLPVKEDWDIVKSKFRRGRNGEIRGYGLVVLPK